MAYQVLARKWRPRTFATMVGQEHVKKALTNALDRDRIHHAYLFTGTRGVGKTTIARILAKSLNCDSGVTAEPCGHCSACTEIDGGRFIDLIEVDAASRTKVEDTRELLENVPYSPTRGRFKVYLIDEVHMLSNHSFNALLKTLEEPPNHVKFLLATTDPQKLPVTILSRCLQFNLKRLSDELINTHLAHVLNEESIEFETDALQLLARAGDGSMRDALSLLDQAIAYCGGRIETTGVRAMMGVVAQDKVIDLLTAVAQGDGTVLMSSIAELDEQAPDYFILLTELIRTLQQLATTQLIPRHQYDDPIEGLQSLAQHCAPETIQLYYQIALMGQRDLPLVQNPRSGFEMILLRMLAFRPLASSSSQTVEPVLTSQPTAKPNIEKQSKNPQSFLNPESSVNVSPVNQPMDSWDQLLQKLNLRGIAKQLAANCVFQQREGDLIQLVLDARHRQLLTSGARERLREALSGHFDCEIRLTIELGEPELETPAQAQDRIGNERQQAAVASIKQDPNVQQLQERLQATVHEESIRPIDDK